MLLKLVDKRVEERQLIEYTKKDRLKRRKNEFLLFLYYKNKFIYLPKTGDDTGC